MFPLCILLMSLMNRHKTSEGLTRSGDNKSFYAHSAARHRRENAERRHENAALDEMDVFNCKVFVLANADFNAYVLYSLSGIKSLLSEKIPSGDKHKSKVAAVLTAIEPQLADARAGRQLIVICLSCEPSAQNRCPPPPPPLASLPSRLFLQEMFKDAHFSFLLGVGIRLTTRYVAIRLLQKEPLTASASGNYLTQSAKSKR